MKTLNRHHSFRLKTILITFILFFILFALFEGLYPKTVLAINKALWENNKPKQYYVRVHAVTSNGCSWTWESIVYKDVAILLTSTTFHSKDKEFFCTEFDWFLDGNKISVDNIFDILERTCVNKGLLNCGSTFDKKYHYPMQSQSYETYSIDIEQFVECNVNQTTCP